MKKYIYLILLSIGIVCAETLFEVKDSANNPVLKVSDDGIAVMNLADTIMVISTTEIKAVIDDSAKALSRKFSVSTTSAKKGLYTDLFDVSLGSATMRGGYDGGRYADFSPQNIFVGLSAGINSTGVNNVFIGNNSGINNISGYGNIFLGMQSGLNNTSGRNNIYIGELSGKASTNQIENLFIGHNSGENATGSLNMFIGNSSGKNTTIGAYNIFLGKSSGYNNTTGENNVFIGQGGVAFNNTEGKNNVYIGYDAAQAVSSTSDNNTYLGYQTGLTQTSGNQNTYVGANSAVTKTSGNYNTFLGYNTGAYNSAGSNNTFIGHQTGYNNTGSGGVFLGYQAGQSETASNKLYIANSSTSTPLIKGTFPNTDLTFKATTITADGNLVVTGSTSVNGNSSVSGTTTSSNLITTETHFRILNAPGSTTTPAYYAYQGTLGSTTKADAFAIRDALWVDTNGYIDGTLTVGSTLQVKGGTVIGKVQAGILEVGQNTTDNYKAITLTFPSAFSTVPKINLTPVNENGIDDIYSVTVRNITTTNCVVLICRVDSATKTWWQYLKVDWMAWE